MPKLGGISSLNPDAIIPKSEQWRLQWDRVKRWKKRIEIFGQRMTNEEIEFHELVDTAIAFIQNCYHLRDWVIACHPKLNKKVANLFKKEFSLKCCRDICNGFKHKNLKNPSVETDFNIFRSYDIFVKRTGSNGDRYIYKIDFSDGTTSKTYKLFDFINECFSIWEEFIKKELT